MSNVQKSTSTAQEIINQRLNELLKHKGNLAHQIEPLQKQLDQINDQLKSLNELAPLFYVVESQTLQRQNEAAKQAQLVSERSNANVESEKQ